MERAGTKAHAQRQQARGKMPSRGLLRSGMHWWERDFGDPLFGANRQFETMAQDRLEASGLTGPGLHSSWSIERLAPPTGISCLCLKTHWRKAVGSLGAPCSRETKQRSSGGDRAPQILTHCPLLLSLQTRKPCSSGGRSEAHRGPADPQVCDEQSQCVCVESHH